MRIVPVLLVVVIASTGFVADLDEREEILLIVRGDDFGFSHASNMALVDAFENGIMTSASLLVNGPWFLETAALVREHPDWSIGIHLTITSEWNRLRWGPVRGRNEVPSLVHEDGFLYSLGYYWRPEEHGPERKAYWAPGPPDLAEVEAELRAQIEKAQRLGVRIDYLDCHMGKTCMDPLLPILQRLATELCVPIPERGLMNETPIGFGQRFTVEDAKAGLKEMLLSLEPGLWRYVEHPAVDTPELRAIDTEWGVNEARYRDAIHQVWQDPEIKQIIAEREIQLVSIRDLWDYDRCVLRDFRASALTVR